MLILAGAIGSISCTILAANAPNFILFAIFYIGSFMFNVGFAMLVTMHHSWLWFGDRPGLASGICSSGFGMGSLVFNSVLTPIFNPQNLKFTSPCAYTETIDPKWNCFPESVNANFKNAMYALIGCYAGCAAIGIICIWQGPILSEEDKQVE